MTKNRQHDLIISTTYFHEILRLSDVDAGALFKELMQFCKAGQQPVPAGVTAKSVLFNLICNDISDEQSKWNARRQATISDR